MHFDTALVRVPQRQVTEVAQLKITAQFAVDTSQQIQVERRGDSGGIVVRENLRIDIFYQVRTHQQRIARLQSHAHLAQKLICRRPVEIPDRASEKQHTKVLAKIPPR